MNNKKRYQVKADPTEGGSTFKKERGNIGFAFFVLAAFTILGIFLVW